MHHLPTLALKGRSGCEHCQPGKIWLEKWNWNRWVALRRRGPVSPEVVVLEVVKPWKKNHDFTVSPVVLLVRLSLFFLDSKEIGRSFDFCWGPGACFFERWIPCWDSLIFGDIPWGMPLKNCRSWVGGASHDIHLGKWTVWTQQWRWMGWMIFLFKHVTFQVKHISFPGHTHFHVSFPGYTHVDSKGVCYMGPLRGVIESFHLKSATTGDAFEVVWSHRVSFIRIVGSSLDFSWILGMPPLRTKKKHSHGITKKKLMVLWFPHGQRYTPKN